MRSLPRRTNRTFPRLFALTVVSASLLLLGVTAACGGGGKADGDVKSPSSSGGTGGASGAGGAGGAGGASGAVSSGGASGGTTTTTALSDGGELQGAKLGTSSHTEVETKGDAGPKAGPGHSQEPGRRVEDIKAIIVAHRDEARACYDKGLKDHPGIEGDLTVAFKIDPAGAVTEASVDSTKSSINEATVGTCITDAIKRIKFAASKGGFETRATYPYNFHPKTYGKPDAGAK